MAKTWPVLTIAAVAAAVLTVSASASTSADTPASLVAAELPPAPADDWRAYVAPDDVWGVDQEPPPSEAAAEASTNAYLALSPSQDIFNQPYFDDGTLILPVKAGREQDAAPILEDFQSSTEVTTAVQIVQLSWADVQAVTERSVEAAHPSEESEGFAGARFAGAGYNSSLDRVVVAITEVNEETVAAARSVLGDLAIYEEGQGEGELTRS